MSRTDEITTAMLDELKLHNIDDTPQNRHDFLLGLRDAWTEDTDRSLEKSLYMCTINLMISLLAIKITIQDR